MKSYRFRYSVIFLLILIIVTWISCEKANIQNSDYSGSMPLIILIERNPWYSVPGSETPRVAIYDDGTVIYKKEVENEYSSYLIKRIDQRGLNSLKREVLFEDEFFKLKNRYKLTHITDLITVEIFVRHTNKHKAISVYGMVPRKENRPSFWYPRTTEKIPKEVIKIYNLLANLSFQDAKAWIPSNIEILIWPYEYSTAEPIVWPKEWPSLEDPLTRKWGDENYSLYISGENLNELKAFTLKLKYNKPVLINGKKWAMTYRFVFPGEFIWNNAFKNARKSGE